MVGRVFESSEVQRFRGYLLLKGQVGAWDPSSPLRRSLGYARDDTPFCFEGFNKPGITSQALGI